MPVKGGGKHENRDNHDDENHDAPPAHGRCHEGQNGGYAAPDAEP